MGKHLKFETLRDNPAEHPASVAWCELRCIRTVPKEIAILKQRNDSKVYRLTGVGPSGSDVIAKHCPRTAALAEQIMYHRVLALLPVTALEHYGLWEEPGDGFSWVFIEDAGGIPYSFEQRAHGVLAAEWLGRMHVAGAKAAREIGLPCWGPERYLHSLRAGRERILQSLANPALSEEDRGVLRNIVTQFSAVQRNWSRIENLCAPAPWTFVHGDLHPKNLRIRTDPPGATLVAFDWECAGWGVPAIDLALPGLHIPTYCSVVRESWPAIDMQILRRQVRAGRLFQLLGLVDWEAQGLGCEWPHRPMKHMRGYYTDLSDIIGKGENAG
jgi:Phosphotransferase enzyme family